MKNILAIILLLALSACASKQVKQSQFDGLAFAEFNRQTVAVINQVENLQLAYIDRKKNQFSAISITPGTNSSKSVSLIEFRPVPSPIEANLLVPVKGDRIIIVQYPPNPTPILICGETHDPCALNGTQGCGGGFISEQGESIKDLLQRIVESNQDSGTSLCGPVEGGAANN